MGVAVVILKRRVGSPRTTTRAKIASGILVFVSVVIWVIQVLMASQLYNAQRDLPDSAVIALRVLPMFLVTIAVTISYGIRNQKRRKGARVALTLLGVILVVGFTPVPETVQIVFAILAAFLALILSVTYRGGLTFAWMTYEGKRKNFSMITKRRVWTEQGHKCALCDKSMRFIQCKWDHINQNRSDNSIENCQCLCKGCHGLKTGEDRIDQY